MHDELLRQYRDRFGGQPRIVREEDGIAVVHIRPEKPLRAEPDTELFLTAGMSARAMNAAKDAAQRVELMVAMPGGWQKMYPAEEPFVVDTLLQTAKYPFTRNTWLGSGHTLPAGRPLAPETKMEGWVLTPPLVLLDDLPLATPDGEARFLLMTPLYPLELNLARAQGTNAALNRIFTMLERLDLDWGFLIKPARPDTVGGTTFFV